MSSADSPDWKEQKVKTVVSKDINDDHFATRKWGMKENISQKENATPYGLVNFSLLDFKNLKVHFLVFKV